MADKPVLIWAVVVVYNPEQHALTKLVESLELQVEGIVVVDNTPSEAREQSRLPMCTCTCVYVHMGGNAGVATALNQGCCRAIEGGATHVLLMDQDSVPDSGMLPALLASLEKADKAGKKVAAAAPRYRDALAPGILSRFVRISWGRSMLLPTDVDVVYPDFVVSSGMLIAISSLRRIGLMDPVLFIDHVDTEWCLRARQFGYCFCGVNDAYMTHRLGDTRIQLWPRWRGELVVHTPERYYYMIRNGLLLQRRNYATTQWRVVETKRLLYLFIVYGLLLPAGAKRLYWMWRGLRDGVAGVSGGLPEGTGL